MGYVNSRLLSKNEKTQVPQYFVFVDVETKLEVINENRQEHQLWFGWAIFWRRRSDIGNDVVEYFYFKSISEFWDYCESKIKGNNTLHIVAHNALFDMAVLEFISQLTDRGYDNKFIFDQATTFIAKWVNKHKRIMILDNTNWFPGKLERWGEILGLRKIKMPKYDDNNEIWVEYCKRDTEILLHLQQRLITFIISNDLGNWKFTSASLAFNAFRHRFMRHSIYIPEKTRETYLARNSYYGGRVECFFSGETYKDSYYKLDVNSMYPYVMKHNLYPTEVYGYVRTPKISRIANNLDRYLMVGKFRIRPTIPYFPNKIDKVTCYPIGEFDAYLTTPEIRLCLLNGWIIKAYEIACYRGESIFSSFVDFFYSERLGAKQSGDELSSAMYKRWLNSLYGKFGQRKYNDTIIGQQEPNTMEMSYFIDTVTGDRGMIRQIGRNIIKSTKGGEGYNSFTAVASHVTAYARIYLYNIIMMAGRSNCYYCDTDSLIVNSKGYDRLGYMLDNYELGKLKVEDKSDYLAVIAPKHYYMGGKVVRKGVRQNAVKVADNTYRQEVWPRLNRLLKDGQNKYFNYFVTKVLTPRIKTGIINTMGEIHPYHIS